MVRVISDGEVKIAWVTTITTISTPTAAELIAGQDLTGYLSSLDTPLDGESVDSSDLSSAFNKSVAGTYGGGATGTFYRDDTTDTAWDTLPRNTLGNLVVRRFGGSTVAFTASDVVEVWPARVIARSPSSMDRNSVQVFTVNFATTDEPTLAATVS